jgi:N-carbamoyl-L-amino-acid hydrolase
MEESDDGSDERTTGRTVAAAVDESRLREDLERNGEFGAVPGEGHGRTVLTGTESNREAREYLVSRLEDAGLAVEVDAVGNIVGRWDPSGATGTPVASGSHLDSVPEGGIFDGPLGVYAALESVRAMQDAGIEPGRPVEVVSFTEEEGTRFSSGLLGSSVAAGEWSPEDALAMADEEGTTLGAALEAIGFRGEGRLDASEWDAWLELHVEQHTELESRGVPAGVVTAVTGITHCSVAVEGEANHAGSTPMGDRRDALCAAAEFVTDLERAANERTEVDPAAVGTVGELSVSPGARNVVPGGVETSLDIRSIERESMEHLVDAARESLDRIASDRGIRTDIEREFDVDPTPMTARCQTALREGAEAAGLETIELHSGAGHDSMTVAAVTDAGMLFAPSRDGVSHSPREWTDWGDCAAATRVLAAGLTRLAG